MLTFSRIGRYGRLGNQMFQYAAVCSLAEKLGTEAWLPLHNTKMTQIFKVPFARLKSEQEIQPYIRQIINEQKYEFTDLSGVPDNSDFIGYFQSYKYFDYNFVKREFSFTPDSLNKIIGFINSRLSHFHTPVSLHVRRTDYLQVSHIHPPLNLEYYRRAVKYIRERVENPQFIVVSDDISWCRSALSNLFTANDSVVFSDSGDEVIDLGLICFSQNQIIANSTFSWWGAYMHNRAWTKDSFGVDSITIAPQQWFGPAVPHTTVDLIPEGWVQL